MKACPGCGYLWADDYSGQCLECGKPLGNVQANGDLRFRYAAQVQAGIREDQLEKGMKASSGKARPGDAYDRVEVPDAVLGAARRMLVQTADVEYEEE